MRDADETPAGPALLDVRPERDFLIAHEPGAANVPLELLRQRLYELPPPGAGLLVMDADPVRVRSAAAFLRQRRYAVAERLIDLTRATEAGPPRVQLWRPSPFLIEAIQHIEMVEGQPLQAWGRHRQAVDLACGSGREAVWLARHGGGLCVDAIDWLPDALEMAAALAGRCGVADRVRTLQRNLEAGPALAMSYYDLAMVFRYLHRPLLPALRDGIRPGGYIIYETFHARTAEAGCKPRSPEHLLSDGELPRAFAGFEILIARDAIQRDGRWFSQLLARRPQG